ncbi:MAG: hypothetical protein RIS44_3376, partial [Pseudomonadota bacterium]
RQRAAERLNRVCSAVNRQVIWFVRGGVSIHRFLPAEVSGQLPFLG